MMVKPASSITPDASMTCAGVAPALSTAAIASNAASAAACRLAIKLVRLAERKTAKHLPRVIPERRADLGHHHVARLHAPHARKLTGYAKIWRIHRRHADVMNDIGRTVRHVGALDQIAELAFVQPGLESIAQRRHAEIAEMRADAQPIKLVGRLHLSQSDVARG